MKSGAKIRKNLELSKFLPRFFHFFLFPTYSQMVRNTSFFLNPNL